MLPKEKEKKRGQGRWARKVTPSATAPASQQNSPFPAPPTLFSPSLHFHYQHEPVPFGAMFPFLHFLKRSPC